MKIYHVTLVFVAAAALVTAGIAQGPGGPGMRGPGGPGGMGRMRGKPGDREKKMLEQLNLTPAQKKKTDAIIDDQVARTMKLMKENGGGRPSPEMRKKFMAMRGEGEGKIMKVLNPAQAKKFKGMIEEARKRMMSRMGGPGGGRMGGPGAPGGAPPKP